jgi:hypothetical protein
MYVTRRFGAEWRIVFVVLIFYPKTKIAKWLSHILTTPAHIPGVESQPRKNLGSMKYCLGIKFLGAIHKHVAECRVHSIFRQESITPQEFPVSNTGNNVISANSACPTGHALARSSPTTERLVAHHPMLPETHGGWHRTTAGVRLMTVTSRRGLWDR